MRIKFPCIILLLTALYSCQNEPSSTAKQQDSTVAPPLSTTTPVTQDSIGDNQGSVMVMLDYKKITERGLTGGTVIDVLAKEEDHLKSLTDYEKLIVGVVGKDTVYLKDVAAFKTMKE